MAELEISDLKDFHDVIRLLEEHPEWRAELRRVVLTDDLLALPQQVARLTEHVAALTAAQTRTEARVAELAAAQSRTETQLAALTLRVDELAAAQARTEARVAELAAAQSRTETQLAALTLRVDELAAAQARTEARVAELAAAQSRTEAQLAALTLRVDELAAAQTRTETQLAALMATVQRLGDDVGTLKGEMLELRYGVRGVPSVGRVLRRPHVLSPDEVYTLIDDAVDHGTLSAEERDQIAEADLIILGKDKKTGTEVYVVMEVSWGVGLSDVRRAVHRATLLAKIGIPTFPAVAGRDITREAREQASRQSVWQFIDGMVVSPES